MELTRTCCFEFDRKRQEVSKGLFLFHCSFYLLLACFTYLSLLPEVDKILSLLSNEKTISEITEKYGRILCNIKYSPIILTYSETYALNSRLEN